MDYLFSTQTDKDDQINSLLKRIDELKIESVRLRAQIKELEYEVGETNCTIIRITEQNTSYIIRKYEQITALEDENKRLKSIIEYGKILQRTNVIGDEFLSTLNQQTEFDTNKNIMNLGVNNNIKDALFLLELNPPAWLTASIIFHNMWKTGEFHYVWLQFFKLFPAAKHCYHMEKFIAFSDNCTKPLIFLLAVKDGGYHQHLIDTLHNLIQ